MAMALSGSVSWSRRASAILVPTSALSFCAARVSASSSRVARRSVDGAPCPRVSLGSFIEQVLDLLHQALVERRRRGGDLGEQGAGAAGVALADGVEGRLVEAQRAALLGQGDLGEQLVGLGVDAELAGLGLGRPSGGRPGSCRWRRGSWPRPGAARRGSPARRAGASRPGAPRPAWRAVSPRPSAMARRAGSARPGARRGVHLGRIRLGRRVGWVRLSRSRLGRRYGRVCLGRICLGWVHLGRIGLGWVRLGRRRLGR